MIEVSYGIKSNGRLVLALMAIFVLVACGGDDADADAKAKQKAELQRKIAERKAASAAKRDKMNAGSPDRMVKVRLHNPGWNKVSGYFQQYKTRMLKNRFTTDIFQPHTAEMVPRPKIRDPAGNPLDPGGKKGRVKQNLHPLQEYELKDLSVVLIMTNVSRPKALVVGPKGAAYEVTVDSKVGKQQGYVERITQYQVLVREKDQTKPLNSLKPKYFDFRRKLQLSKGKDVLGLTDRTRRGRKP